MPTGVMMRSVSVNNKDEEITFHVIVDDMVADRQKRQLENVVKDNGRHKVKFVTVKRDIFASLPGLDGKVKDYITMATYYRLIITELLDRSIDKVLYLDGDIVCNGPLNGLWATDIDDVAVAGAPDMSEAQQEYDRLGYPESDGYFNAGVLLINLDYWRKNGMTQKFFSFLSKYPECIKFHDQDVLNIFFHDCKAHLHLRYNLQNGYLFRKELMQFDPSRYGNELVEAIDNPVIIHYTSSIKPWHAECMNPLHGLWFKYLDDTEWKEYKIRERYPIEGFKPHVVQFLRFIHILPQIPPRENPYITLCQK